MRRLPKGRVRGSIRVPGSKSALLRALAVAAMASGHSRIHGGSRSEDAEAMIRVLRALGATIATSAEPWVVEGGTLRVPDEPLDCGESGLTARVAIALATTVDGEVTITGRGRLVDRPMGPLIAALRSQGLTVGASSDGTLPITIGGQGSLWGGEVSMSTDVSTQFLSALLLVAPTADHPLAIRTDERAGALGYVDMTVELMANFGARPIETSRGYEVPASGYRPAAYAVPPDASSAAYPAVAAAITGGEVTLVGLSLRDRQPDMAVLDRLREMGCVIEQADTGILVRGPETLRPIDADMAAAPDGALALGVACLFASGPSRLMGLSTLRIKESDRLEAMAEGLSRLGADVEISGDTLEISPKALAAAEIRAHGDHRVAMSLALAGLRMGGVGVDEPEVVSKTWPGYWEAMASLVISDTER